MHIVVCLQGAVYGILSIASTAYHFSNHARLRTYFFPQFYRSHSLVLSLYGIQSRIFRTRCSKVSSRIYTSSQNYPMANPKSPKMSQRSQIINYIHAHIWRKVQNRAVYILIEQQCFLARHNEMAYTT